MKKETLAYIAGFFDGEGSITIHENCKPSPRGLSPNHTMQVSIGNTDPTILAMLHDEFGGSFVPRKLVSTNHRLVYQWIIRARKALPFLVAIRPYLVMKAKQADVAIAFQQKKSMRGPKRVTRADIAWRESQRTKIRRLNGRFKH